MLRKWLQSLGKLGGEAPTFTEIRQESFRLGSRHQGEIAKGAELELKSLDPRSRRALLLNAIILKERTA